MSLAGGIDNDDFDGGRRREVATRYTQMFAALKRPISVAPSATAGLNAAAAHWARTARARIHC